MSEINGENQIAPKFADKDDLLRLLKSQYVRLGVTFDPAATAQQARALALQDGVKPEENAFSCALIKARVPAFLAIH